MYVDHTTKKDHANVKKMKDKTRVILMVYTAADGSKIPHAVVGKPK